MNSNASAVTARDRINHVKVVVLALLASLIIMLIGITARATDDTNGYEAYPVDSGSSRCSVS
jgi:hypothetical protein